jgi:predicted P-loop ATPase
MTGAIISLYPVITDTKNGKDISIETFLQQVKDGRWIDDIIDLRSKKTDEERKKAKSKLPYVTISGQFKERNEMGIVKHSGFLCIDIDNLGDSVHDAKAELASDNYFHAVFISCSGNGLCAIAKINPKAHLESFNFLSEHLYTKYNINIDEKCKDISRPRFVTYDPEIHINENSQLTPVIPETKKKKPVPLNYVFVEDDFNNIVNQITASKVDLTCDYGNWIKIGFAIVNKFGENGRNYFHALSQYNDGYNFTKADNKYTHLLKSTNEKISIGFIYYLAKQQGLRIYSEKTQSIIRSAKTVKRSNLVGDKKEVTKKYLVKLHGLTEKEATEAEPLINQVLAEPVSGTEENLILDIKTFIRQNYNLRRNVISRNIELDGKSIDDITLNSIFINCRTSIEKATKDIVTSIIFSEFTTSYNPFAEIIKYYFDNPPEPIEGYIDQLIKSIKTDTPHADLFIKKWLVSLIASIKGYHSPLMLVLCGGQNTGKTHWFRHLLPTDLCKYYAESKLDLGKDDEILMTKKLIIMDDEMGGKSKQEQKKLKEMTSKQTFSIREPYGRVSVDLQRLAMLCGTTNDEEILNDPTGNRRILPVRVLDIDRELYNSVNKDLVFFEAAYLYDNDFDYNLSKEDIEKLRDSGIEFKQSSSEEELVSKYFGLPSEHPGSYPVDRTNSEILSYIQNQSNVKLSQTKLGLILKEMKFHQTHKKINNTTIRVYKVIELSTHPVNQPVNQEKAPF